MTRAESFFLFFIKKVKPNVARRREISEIGNEFNKLVSSRGIALSLRVLYPWEREIAFSCLHTYVCFFSSLVPWRKEGCKNVLRERWKLRDPKRQPERDEGSFFFFLNILIDFLQFRLPRKSDFSRKHASVVQLKKGRFLSSPRSKTVMYARRILCVFKSIIRSPLMERGAAARFIHPKKGKKKKIIYIAVYIEIANTWNL